MNFKIISFLMIITILFSNFSFAIDCNNSYKEVNENNASAVHNNSLKTFKSINESENLNNMSDVYIACTGDDILGDGSPKKPLKSLKASLKRVKNNGTIHIFNGSYGGVNNTNLEVNLDVEIIGEDSSCVVINGSNNNQIFKIAVGKTVKISNLTLTNGMAYNGGAIENLGNLTIEKCNLINNTALKSGGAIYNNGSLVMCFNRIVKNKAFTGESIFNNRQLAVNASNNWWGTNNNPKTGKLISGNVNCDPWIKLIITSDRPITSPNQTITIKADLNHNSNNEYISSKGAIPLVKAFFNAENGKVNHDSQIINQGAEATVKIFTEGISNCSICYVTVDDCKISTKISINRFADIYISPEGDDKGNGSDMRPYKTLKKAYNMVSNNGCIHVLPGSYQGEENQNITITKNITIINDKRSEYDFIDDHDFNPFNLLIFLKWVESYYPYSKYPTFCAEDNTIFLIQNNTTVNIQNLNFKNNHAKFSAIQNTGSLTLDNCCFTNNSAIYGGAIKNLNNLTVYHCFFEKNRANILSSLNNSHGGAIYNNKKLIVINSTFRDNTALTEGGAVFNNGNFSAQDNKFNNNEAGNNGGAIMNRGNCDLDSDKFIGNTVKPGTSKNVFYSGGAIFNNGNLKTKKAYFKDNHAATGGAILNKGNLTLYESGFYNNRASEREDSTKAGAIMNQGNFNATNSYFSHNSATHEGGAIVAEFNSSTYFDKCLLNDNKAEYGGALVNRGNFSSVNSVFENNNADKSGGAILNYYNANLNGKNILKHNSALFGGAINNLDQLTMVDFIMSDNEAKGAIHMGDNSFSGGGAIYNKGRLWLENGTFDFNSANYGGALDNCNFANVKNCIFTYNGYHNEYNVYNYEYPVPRGGAISNSAELSAEYNTFDSNIISTRSWIIGQPKTPLGGAIYNNKNAQINHNNFYFNTATTISYEKGGTFYTLAACLFGIPKLFSDEKLINDDYTDEIRRSPGKDVFNEGNCDLESNYWASYTFDEEGYDYNHYQYFKDQGWYLIARYYKDSCETEYMKYIVRNDWKNVHDFNLVNRNFYKNMLESKRHAHRTNHYNFLSYESIGIKPFISKDMDVSSRIYNSDHSCILNHISMNPF